MESSKYYTHIELVDQAEARREVKETGKKNGGKGGRFKTETRLPPF